MRATAANKARRRWPRGFAVSEYRRGVSGAMPTRLVVVPDLRSVVTDFGGKMDYGRFKVCSTNSGTLGEPPYTNGGRNESRPVHSVASAHRPPWVSPAEIKPDVKKRAGTRPALTAWPLCRISMDGLDSSADVLARPGPLLPSEPPHAARPGILISSGIAYNN